MTPLTLPIAELFHSYQGEGMYTGTPMLFVRLAGCNIGRHPETVTWEIGKDRDFPILKTGYPAYICHTYDGRPFYCDTDFHHGDPWTIEDILKECWEQHICITGGEPFLHKDKINAFVDNAIMAGIEVHIETSGTLDWDPGLAWITCSPKQNYLDSMIKRADEIKLLVDKDFDLFKVPDCINDHPRVYIQPVNDELFINLDNLKLCKEVFYARPNWRLSVQLHKCFGWR